MILSSLRVIAVILSAVLIASCSDTKPAYVEKAVGILYNDAMDKLAGANYIEAAQAFDEVERQHPYSSWAIKAKVLAAFSYYQAAKFDEAILAANRFIELHPGNVDIGYAYYLLAISYYEQISDVGRDHKMTQRALGSLEDVVRRFPASDYARDARLKVDLTRDHLAGKEMAVGRYYLKRGQYVGALNRFRAVIEQYQSTSHVPEALHRLTETYLALGVEREAQTAGAVLGYNYPNSEWYEDSYGLLRGRNLEPREDRSSWISRIWRGVF